MNLKLVLLFSVAVGAGKKGGRNKTNKRIEKPNYGISDLNDVLYPEAKLVELSNAGVDVSAFLVAKLFEGNDNTVRDCPKKIIEKYTNLEQPENFNVHNK